MITRLKWWVGCAWRGVRGRKATVAFMADHLHAAADMIEALRRENKVLRIRGERLAHEIEANDWTVESASRLCDAVALWREMSD